jgi:TPR repeat protein
MILLLQAVSRPKGKLFVSAVVTFALHLAFGAADAGTSEFPPPALRRVAGASADQLWQMAQQRYRANDHQGAAVIARQAALAGSAIAAYEVGYLYENGDGVARDDGEALRWFQYGAARGSRECEMALGARYEAGGPGQPENFEAALPYYRSAASKGYPDASYAVARMYEYGLGVPLDLKQAVAWYAQAARQGDPKAAGRENNLLQLYLKFDDTFASVAERDLFTDEGPRLVPTGMVFHSLAERMAFLRQHAGVKRDAAAAAQLRALDNQAILARQEEVAAEQRREWEQLTPEQRAQIVASRQELARRYIGMLIWRQSNPGYSSPGVPF